MNWRDRLHFKTFSHYDFDTLYLIVIEYHTLQFYEKWGSDFSYIFCFCFLKFCQGFFFQIWIVFEIFSFYGCYVFSIEYEYFSYFGFRFTISWLRLPKNPTELMATLSDGSSVNLVMTYIACKLKKLLYLEENLSNIPPSFTFNFSSANASISSSIWSRFILCRSDPVSKAKIILNKPT